MPNLVAIVALVVFVIAAVITVLLNKHAQAQGDLTAAFADAGMCIDTHRDRRDSWFGYRITDGQSNFQLTEYISSEDKGPRYPHADLPRSAIVKALLEKRYYGVTGHHLLCIRAAELDWVQIVAQMTPRWPRSA